MKKELLVIHNLIKRGTKIFLKDKAGVFFSLLAPLIVLFLYVMFLGDIQMRSLEESLAGLNFDKDSLQAIVDGWMLAGVMAVSCITVSFSAQNLMIADRETGVISDMLTAPIKRRSIAVSYLLYNFVVTLVIVLTVLVIAFIYLAITGWYLSAGQTFAIIGVVIISIVCSSLLSSVVCMFIKTQTAHSGIVGIMSAAIGFLIGAYMPVSIFPKAIQYIVLFIPGTYSAGLLRNYFMDGALDEIVALSPEAAAGIRDGFSMEMDFFGKNIGPDIMWVMFAVTIVILMAAYAGVTFVKIKKGTMFKEATPKKRSKRGNEANHGEE